MRISHILVALTLFVLIFQQIHAGCTLTQQQLEAIPDGYILTTTSLSIGFEQNFINESGINNHFGSEIASSLGISSERVCVYDIDFDLYFITRVVFLPDFLQTNDGTPQSLMNALRDALFNPSHSIHNQLISRSIDRTKVFEDMTALTLRKCVSTTQLQSVELQCDDPIVIDSVDESGSLLSILLCLATFLLTGVLFFAFLFLYTAYERQADIKHKKFIERNKMLQKKIPSSSSSSSTSPAAASSPLSAPKATPTSSQ